MNFFRKDSLVKLFWLLLFLFFTGSICCAQTVGDFRSATLSGNWQTNSSWQMYNGTLWVAATSYPGQNAGNEAVSIQAGNNITIPAAGVTTQPMGTLIINGKLTLNGDFDVKSMKIVVTPPTATIEFNKALLKLPDNASLVVSAGGLSGSCNHNDQIQIGTVNYAYCAGAPGTAFTFAELMAAGGTLVAISNFKPISCLGDPVTLTGNYLGAIGTPVTYKWSSTGPAPLIFSPNSTAKVPTITPTLPGTYFITLTVSTNKGVVVYSNTQNSTLVVPPSSSTYNVAICKGDLYPFDGKTYSTTGTYKSNLYKSSVTGCDSLAYLNLTVIEYSNTFIKDTICQGETYNYNGVSYKNEGDYPVTTNAGCSNTILSLKVKKSSYFNYNDSICLGSLYSFHGNTYDTSGSYTVHLINKAGCDSVATLQLFVKSPTASLTKDSICLGQSYVFNGIGYNATGTYSKTLVNKAGCDSVAILQLFVKSPTASLHKQTICSTQLPYSWDGLTFVTGGIQIKNLTNAVGCDSTATFELTANLTTSSVTTDSICSTSSTYLWNGTEYNFAGTYSKKFVNSVGCDSIATLELTLCSQATDTTCPITISDINVCPNINAQLNASGADYYFWSPSAGLSNTTVANPIVNVAKTTKYTITAFTEGIESLIKNGDFEKGNQDFSSDYNYTDTNLIPEGNYTVGTNPKLYHNAFSACGDHTSGTGKMLIVNGNTTANSKIWGQTINVKSNRYYAFSAYVTPVHATNPPIIQFSINGSVLGTPFNSPGGTCSWNRFYAIWYSGISTTANISIVNQNIIANGNDFAIDDIKYVDLCKTVDTVTVSVGLLTSTTNMAKCSSEFPYKWNGISYNTPGTYSIHLISSVGCDSVATLVLTKKLPTTSLYKQTICSTQLPYTWDGLTFAAAGTQIKNLTNAVGCDSTATYILKVNPIPTVTNIPLTQTICSGTSTTLVNLTSDVASTTFEWTASTDTAITGFTTNGTTNTIPAQTLTNPSNSTAGTVTYVITPKANGCTGTAVNYVVTVDPKPITSDIYHQ